MREFYSRILPVLGCEVVGVAADGSDLVDVCGATEPDLVISDIRMPRLDGLAAAERILERMNVPFIFVSAYHDRELIDRVMQLNSYGYLVKPIKQQDLETAIPVAIKRFREAEGQV